MLEEVKEGLALAFLEKMVSRDELWITATVSASCVLYVWQLPSHPTASFGLEPKSVHPVCCMFGNCIHTPLHLLVQSVNAQTVPP